MTVISLTVKKINYSDFKKPVESILADKKPGRGADQFPLRFPDGMREEIKRLADEDGQSMNTKIIDLLTFATENSGLDIDALLQGMVEQNQEISRLRRLLDKEQDLATTVLWHVLGYADQIPAELTIWADNLLRVLDPEQEEPTAAEHELARIDAPKEEVQRKVLEAKERRLRYMDKAVARIMKERGDDIDAIREGYKGK
jgi:hypothetical protein